MLYLENGLLEGVWQLGVQGLWQQAGQHGGHQAETAKDEEGDELLLVFVDVLPRQQNLRPRRVCTLVVVPSLTYMYTVQCMVTLLSSNAFSTQRKDKNLSDFLRSPEKYKFRMISENILPK